MEASIGIIWGREAHNCPLTILAWHFLSWVGQDIAIVKIKANDLWDRSVALESRMKAYGLQLWARELFLKSLPRAVPQVTAIFLSLAFAHKLLVPLFLFLHDCVLSLLNSYAKVEGKRGWHVGSVRKSLVEGGKSACLAQL